MFKKIFANSDLPFPHTSLVLILCSLVVSIPIYFDQTLYFSLGANYGLHSPFQIIISRFAHGPNPPLLLHLFVNVLVIAMFGILTERILGTPKTLMLVISAIIVELIIRYSTNRFGNGISGAAWAFSPMGFYFVILSFRMKKLNSLKDGFIIFSILLLILIWLFITIYTGVKYHWFTGTNIYHSAAVLTGTFYLLLNKNQFEKTAQNLIGDQISKENTTDRLKFPAIVFNYLFLLFAVLNVFFVLFNK